MAESSHHTDFLSTGQESAETFKALLARRLLKTAWLESVDADGDAFGVIVIAMAICATNLQILEEWDATVASNRGRIPNGSYRAQDRIRGQQLNAYFAFHRRVSPPTETTPRSNDLRPDAMARAAANPSSDKPRGAPLKERP